MNFHGLIRDATLQIEFENATYARKPFTCTITYLNDIIPVTRWDQALLQALFYTVTYSLNGS